MEIENKRCLTAVQQAITSSTSDAVVFSSPSTPEYLAFKAKTLAIKTLSELPHIQYADLENPNLLIAKGYGHRGIYRANSGGREVLVKKSVVPPGMDDAMALRMFGRSRETLIIEYKWASILHSLGLGPPVHGITVFPDGHFGLVTGYVEGWDLAQEIQKGKIKPGPHTDELKARLRESAKELEAAGIRYTLDLQWRVTSDNRVLVIDPEFFREAPPLDPPRGLEHVITDPVKRTEQYIERLP